MTPTLLDRPARDRALAASGAGQVPLRRRRDPRWLYPVALTTSALIHVVALLVFRFTAPDYRAAIAAVRTERANAPMTGIRIVQVLPMPEAPDVPVIRAEEPEPEPPALAPVTPPAVTPQPGVPSVAVTGPGPDDPGTLLDRVRTRGTDTRLWTTPAPPAPVERLDPVTEALIPLYAALGALNDSMRIAAEAAERVTDWTVKDENGGRWGVTPGAIHLGKITLPLPFAFSAPPGRRDELSGRIRGWGEIQRQAGQAAVRDGFNDRVKAIRERNNAARDTTKSGGG